MANAIVQLDSSAKWIDILSREDGLGDIERLCASYLGKQTPIVPVGRRVF